MFEKEQRLIEEQIKNHCRAQGLPQPALQWTWIPFSGEWGISLLFFNWLPKRRARKVCG